MRKLDRLKRPSNPIPRSR